MKRSFVLVVAFCFFITGAIANKTSIEIKAPAEVKAGTEVTIVINVMHKGNSKGHHTEWVYLKINGKEVNRWTYTKTSLPSEENFTLEFKYIVSDPITIEAEGNCNIHGSAGEKTLVVKTVN